MSVHIDGDNCCTEMSNEDYLSKYVENLCGCDQMVINLEELGSKFEEDKQEQEES